MSQALIALSKDELAQVVREAVEDALSEHAGAPELLDRVGLARALTCSPGHVDNLRKKPGFPTVWVGEVPRFRLADVLAWLTSTAVS